MYAIVKFIEENDAPGIVCSHWINQEETMCLYPNVKTNEARDRLLRKLAQPAQDWTSCKIKILHKYGSFGEASIYLPKAEETSNLESEADDTVKAPRKKAKRHLMYPGEDSSDEEPPLASKSKKQGNPIDPYPRPYPNSQNSCKNNQIRAVYNHTQLENSQTVINEENLGTDQYEDIQLHIQNPGSIQASILEKQGENRNLSLSSSARKEKSPVFPSTSQTVINGRLIAWMADISKKIQDLDDKMELILNNQAELLKQQNLQVPVTSEKNEEVEEILGSLPVTDDSTFVQLNKKIAEDSHLRNLLVKVFISVGGKDMRCHIHNMLRRILSDDVAELYSLSGKSTLKNAVKKSFVATEISKAMFSACQRVFKDMATEVKVKEAVGDWLNQAKVRKIRRMQRQEKNMDNNQD